MAKNLFDVKGRTVVITGGLGQLGRAFTRALAAQGVRVAIFDSGARKVGQSRQVLTVPVDVTRQSSIEEGLRLVIKRWGVPYGLINNAALDSTPDAPASESGPFERYPRASWERVMEVNVTGTMLCCQTIGSAMARAGRGSIINISSIYGLVSPDQRIYEYRRKKGDVFFKPVTYAVSKSAVLNLTRYLATYWAGSGVRVNTLSFGGVARNQSPAFLKGYCSRAPIGRMAREDEYNGAVIFLLSEASSYMTGSNMIIDGGWTAW